MNCNIVKGVLIYSGATPLSPTLTPTPTFTPTPTITPTQTPTITPTITPSFTPTFTPSTSAVSVSAYDFAAAYNKLWGVEMKAGERYDHGVGRLVLDGVETKVGQFDGVEAAIGIGGVATSSETVDKSTVGAFLSAVEHTPQNVDSATPTIAINGVDHAPSGVDNSELSQSIDGVDHTFSSKDSAHETESLEGVQHIRNVDASRNAIELDAIQHIRNVDAGRTNESLNGVNTSYSRETANINESLNGVDHSQSIQKSSESVALSSIVHIPDPYAEKAGQGIALSSVGYLLGPQEPVNITQSIHSIVDKMTDLSDRYVVGAALSAVEIEFGGVQKAEHGAQLSAVDHTTSNTHIKVGQYNRMTSLQHTSDGNAFKINEKMRGTMTLTAVQHNESDSFDTVDLGASLEAIQHNESDEFDGVGNAASIDKVQHLDNHNDGVEQGVVLTGVDHNSRGKDQTNEDIGVDSVGHHASDNVNNGSIGIELSAAIHSTDQQKIVDTITIIAAQHLDGKIDKISATNSLSAVRHIDGVERTIQGIELQDLSHIHGLDMASIFGGLTGIEQTRESSTYEPVTMGIELSAGSMVFQEGRTMSVNMNLEQITHIFGDNHNIGVVMGIGDGNSMVYAAQPTLFDMSLTGIAHLASGLHGKIDATESLIGVDDSIGDTSNKVGATQNLTGVEHVNILERIGGNIVLDNLIHSINTDGTLQYSIGTTGTVHNTGNSYNKARFSFGLFAVEHLRDVFYFDNTDTIKWDNDLVTWDNDPPPHV